MTKDELKANVDLFKAKTRDALQAIYDALNQGQQKQIVKNENVKALFELYGVDYIKS